MDTSDTVWYLVNTKPYVAGVEKLVETMSLLLLEKIYLSEDDVTGQMRIFGT